MLQYGDKIDETETFIEKEHEERAEEYKSTLNSMIHVVEEYHKWIEIESK